MPDNYEKDLDSRQLAYKRYEEATSTEYDNREKATEDVRFSQLEDAQWDNEAFERRRNRPRYTINKIAVAENQVIGEQRQGRMAIKVRPAGGQATLDISNTYNGLIKNIENVSKARNAYDTAFKFQVMAGFGAWRIITEYSDEDTFDQDIVIKQISDPLAQVWFDPLAKDENKRDAKYCFISYDMALDTFKQVYPDATPTDFENTRTTNYYYRNWFTAETVRVAEYFERIPYKKKLILLTDGRVIDYKKYKKVKDELATQGVFGVVENGKERTKTIKTHKVIWRKISGAETLEGPKEWPGKYIPVVPVYGFNFYMDNNHFYRGMTRLAKDAQRVYNYTTSAKVEATALTPKDPYWLTSKQAEGYESQLQNFNVRNNPFMFYNVDPQAPGPPSRTGAPAVQSALIEQTQQADQDIKATTGKFAPSIGENPRDESGRAIIAQQQKGDAATYELIDNLAKGIEYTGEILLDLIPRIYDTERQVRIIKEDGETEFVTINQVIEDRQSGQKIKLNDLSQGKYDVVSTYGPSVATKRQESLMFLRDMAQASPLFAQVSPDLMAKNVDFAYADELSARLRKVMLQQGLVQPNEKEQQEMQANAPKGPDPIQQQMFIKLQLENEELAAKIDRIAIENENKRVDTEKSRAELNETLKGDLETPKLPSEVEAIEKNTELLNQSLDEDFQEKVQEQQKLALDNIANLQGQQEPQAQQPVEQVEIAEAGELSAQV
jgi:hypothetical protein